MSSKHLACLYSQEQKKKTLDFCEKYKEFLNVAKTERLAVFKALELAKAAGYVAAEEKQTLCTGDKVYFVNHEKNLCLVHIGQQPLEQGLSLVSTHIDAPRLDLKPQPVHEETEIALMKTQYYGGIKKYQWGSRPLALYGVVYTKNGTVVRIGLGDGEDDPVFTIPDLLPHLDGKVQRDRTSREVLRGEELRVVFYSTPKPSDKEDEKDLVKKALLAHLQEHYGIEEEDFLSAELEVVPAGKACDVGLDRALIGAYGQDDRVCSYAGLQAILQQDKTPRKTALLFLADKEEIGSIGISGAQSNYWRYVIARLLTKTGKPSDTTHLLQCLWNSVCLSGDVTAAVDPIFKEVHDEQNTAKLHYGLAITKYTGSGGKSHASEAEASLVAKLRQLFSTHQVAYQVGQMGKVDEGGGGTVAAYFANHGVSTIDCGVPVLAMHSPFEITSKWDIYATFEAYRVFFAQGV